MKYSLTLILLFSLFDVSAQLKIMSYNIRYDNAGDSINQWGNRKEKMGVLIKKYNPDIACFQEVLVNQLRDLQLMLSSYSHYGVGRDDGKTKGEFSPIFYNTYKFKKLKGGTFWLSKTPKVVGSIGWDAAITRICTYVKLKEKSTGRIFFVFNAHYDHIGDTARQMSSKLILKKIKTIANKLPVILAGDFNSEPDDKAYLTIGSAKKPKLTDSFNLGEHKKDCTFTGFSVAGNVCKRIDYIFYSQQFNIKDFFIADNNDGANYVSDHLPVVTVMGWK